MGYFKSLLVLGLAAHAFAGSPIVKEDELCKSSLDELWASPPNETSDSFGEMKFTDSEFPQAKRNSGKRRATPFAKLQTYPINNTSKGK